MPAHPRHLLIGALLSVLLHAVLGVVASGWWQPFERQPTVRPLPENVLFMEAVIQPEKNASPAKDPSQPAAPAKKRPMALPPAKNQAALLEQPTPPATKHAASMPAPPPPTAEEWAFAARYTNKNSKGYRYSWGQQVRSMMGTAVEGPDQGMVRLRVEIAPDGRLSRLETLWSTSAVAEQLARQAIAAMPPLPPTPTGKPLVFEKTISFTPYASDGPPVYKDDCRPDPPAFRNRYSWNGTSHNPLDEPEPTAPLDPQALEECLKQLPKDSLEAEAAHDQRWLEQWRSPYLGR